MDEDTLSYLDAPLGAEFLHRCCGRCSQLHLDSLRDRKKPARHCHTAPASLGIEELRDVPKPRSGISQQFQRWPRAIHRSNLLQQAVGGGTASVTLSGTPCNARSRRLVLLIFLRRFGV